MKNPSYKVASMFAGAGGICLGFKNAGADIIWANELDRYACITYRENFGSSYLVEADVTSLDFEDIPDFDILTAGFPCQAFSIAGYQKGFSDERGNLFFDVVRMIKTKKPRVIFLENVKNLTSHDNGRTFKVICQTLKNIGYSVKAKVMNSMEYANIPQNRERIFIVGFRNKNEYRAFDFPKKIKLNKTIHDIIDIYDKKEDKYYYTNSKYYNKLKEHMINKNTVYQIRRVYIRENKSLVCPTLTANMGTGGHNVPLIWDKYDIRKLTPRECFLFQGFPSNFKIPKEISDAQAYKQAGNSVTASLIERIADNVMKVLQYSDIDKYKLSDLNLVDNKQLSLFR